jgi:antitoxin HicB
MRGNKRNVSYGDYYMNLPYQILLTPPEQEGDAWFAEIPLLEGCGTSGISPEEAISELNEAKRLWLEMSMELVASIPEPERVS